MADATVTTGIFVYGLGTTRAITGGTIVADQQVNSPLPPHAIAHLVVGQDQLTLFRAKRKLTAGFKDTGKELLSVPRATVAGGQLQMAKTVGMLQVVFADGAMWLFEVPRVGNRAAPEVAHGLGWRVV